MKLLRRLLRLVALTLLALVGLLIQLLVFPWLSSRSRRATIRRWSQALLAACGVEVVVADSGAAHGRALPAIASGRMLVANHVSWLDIFAINSIAASAFVAKSELRAWPLVGWLVSLAGTVFIERGRRSAVRAVNHQLAGRIRDGYPVALFPEATTWAGPDLLPFHANLFEAAIAAGAEIVPLAIDYRDDNGGPGCAAWYVGDTTFIDSLWMILGESRLTVCVAVLPVLSAERAQRHALAREARERISRALPRTGQTLGDEADNGSGKAADLRGASR